ARTPADWPADRAAGAGRVRRQPAGLLVVAAECAEQAIRNRGRVVELHTAERRVLRVGAGQPGAVRAVVGAVDRRRAAGGPRQLAEALGAAAGRLGGDRVRLPCRRAVAELPL